MPERGVLRRTAPADPFLSCSSMAFCRRWRRRIVLTIALVLLLPLLLSVSELHRDPAAEEGSRGGGKRKFDRLVFGPAAGQGLPDRLQCRGFKALNKTHHSSLSQPIGDIDSISFVTVFTIYNSSPSANSMSTDDKSSDKVIVGNMSYSKVERSMKILHTYIDFIQVAMPHSDVIILTDPASAFSVGKSYTAILPIKGDYSRGNLMLQRIVSYIEFLETRLKGLLEMPKHVNHYIFTDSDIAVVDDLGHIFQNYPHFHLALTFRNNKDQPINSGFIAVRGTRDGIIRAKVFLQRVLEVYSSKYMKASRMLGDQLALAWIVKSQISLDAKKFAKPKPFETEVHGATILFLPCAVYNWTPPEGAGQFHGMPLDVKDELDRVIFFGITHFKAISKRGGGIIACGLTNRLLWVHIRWSPLYSMDHYFLLESIEGGIGLFSESGNSFDPNNYGNFLTHPIVPTFHFHGMVYISYVL